MTHVRPAMFITALAGLLLGSSCGGCGGGRPWARCGDGQVDPGEECDSAGVETGDCTSACRVPWCGNGAVERGEACDDGNASNQDACTTACRVAHCGDGYVQRDGVDGGAGEECDDANHEDGDGCTNTCRQARCGDGVLWVGHEPCDDGNADDQDGCSNDCRTAACGNGRREPGEQCDDGNTNDHDGCLTACTAARCGDGVVRPGFEQCDEGVANGKTAGGCAQDCRLPGCGNGTLDPGEECDDGNGEDGDACLTTCTAARAGDGVVWVGHELCDDGNRVDADACPTTGRPAACGDGFTFLGREECDDGNADDADGCRNGCMLPRCGDAAVQRGPLVSGRAPEECDDGNLDNTDGCLVNCRALDLCQAFRITRVDPASECVPTAPTALTLTSTGFLFVNGVAPAVTFGGVPVVPQSPAGCTDLVGTFNRVTRCTSVVIPQADPALPAGTYDIVVTNPVTQPCTGTAAFLMMVPPTVSTFLPATVCEGPNTFTATGTGFTPLTSVALDQVTGGTAHVPADGVTAQSSTQLSASFNDLDPGRYEAVVGNGASCAAPQRPVVTVLADPKVFFVDPEVLYNGVGIQVTVYVSGINGNDVTSVSIRPSGSTAARVTLPHVYNVAKPNQVQATVPAGLAPGMYEVQVVDANGCPAELANAFRVTATVNVDLALVDPPFGWTGKRTDVLLETNRPVTAGKVGFQSLPRVYLSPVGATGALATPASAVAFNSSLELSAIIPAGLVAGSYDVIVVNPDGTVGVLTGGFRVSPDPVPVIDDVTPGSLVQAVPAAARITGAAFRAGATVTTFCRAAGVTTTGTGTNVVVTPALVTADITSPTAGAVCVVRVTNTDGTYAEFSALGTTNSSLNLNAFIPQGNLATARRAPAVASGRVTRTARYLYVLGGDSGATNGALATIEATPLDRFGDTIGFRTLAAQLPAPRTVASAVTLGRFIYLVGGDTGAAATGSVTRTMLLDPADAPVIASVDLALAPAGLGAGIWYYRVSAVKDATDPSNRNGETLPSDPQPMRVPVGLPQPLEVTLAWTAVPHAASYRIYRSASPDLTAGNEVLLATVPGSSLQFTDTGGATVGGAFKALGELGAWMDQGSLQKPREGHGVALGADPATAGLWHLYALSGFNRPTGLVDTYERLPITVNADGSQSSTSWTEDLANRFGAARWQASGVAAYPALTARVPANTTFIYLGGGYSNAAATNSVQDIDAGRVTAGGALSALASMPPMTQTSPGYAFACAADQLLSFGGSTSAVGTTGGFSGEICAAGVNGCGARVAPETKNWNAGFNLGSPRVLMGSALESGHIFVVGGNGGAGTPVNTVESVVW